MGNFCCKDEIRNYGYEAEIIEYNNATKYKSSTCYEDFKFVNWGETVKFQPECYYWAISDSDYKKVVAQATQRNLLVASVGIGHSWTPFAESSNILVNTERMKNIRYDGETGLMWIGPGVTSRDLRYHYFGYKLNPASDVVLDVTSWAGMVSTGCHGAGINHGPLSDYVERIKIMDATGQVTEFHKDMAPITVKNAKGEDVVVSGAQQLAAVQQAMGSFGLITEIGLRMIPSSNAEIHDIKVPVNDVFDINAPEKFTKTLFESGWDWIEFIFYPYQEQLFLKRWKLSDKAVDLSASDVLAFKDIKGWLTNIEAEIFKNVEKLVPAFVKYSIHGIPVNKGIATFYDATHWQQQLHYFPKLQAFEFSFPFTKTECKHAVQVFLDIKEQLVEWKAKRKFPVSVAVEARVNRGCATLINPSVILPPGSSKPDEYFVFHIEMIAFNGNPDFEEFCQHMFDRWKSMESLQGRWKPRPHWAKYFTFLKGVYPYCRELYGDNMELWKMIRNYYDPKGHFLTNWIREIFYPGTGTAAPAPLAPVPAPAATTSTTPSSDEQAPGLTVT